MSGGSVMNKAARGAGLRSARLAAALAVITWTSVLFYPLVFMLSGSLKSGPELTSRPWGLPRGIVLQNYAEGFLTPGLDTNMARLMLNSAIVTAGTVVLVGLFSAMAAYALARYEWTLRSFMLSCFALAVAIPGQALIVPLYRLILNLGLKDSYWALILPYTAASLPFSVVMLRAYFVGFPRELEEAARIDGCGEFGMFFRIFLPLSRGGLAVICTVAAIGAWNELMLAMTFITDPARRTLSAALVQYSGNSQTSPNEPVLFAILCMATAPIVLLFVFFQRHVLKGATVGGVKG